MTNNEEIIRLENENNNLVEQIKSIKEGNESRIDRITSIRNEKDRELAVKDVEFTEAIQKKIQAQLGVPHSRIQVELGFILQTGTCQILNFA